MNNSNSVNHNRPPINSFTASYLNNSQSTQNDENNNYDGGEQQFLKCSISYSNDNIKLIQKILNPNQSECTDQFQAEDLTLIDGNAILELCASKNNNYNNNCNYLQILHVIYNLDLLLKNLDHVDVNAQFLFFENDTISTIKQSNSGSLLL